MIKLSIKGAASILQNILAFLARATISKYKPLVIGVTGSVGKTSTKEAVFAVLKNKYRARTSEKNYNNEIGLPLTILGAPHCGRNVFAWLSVLVHIAANFYMRKSQEYPKVLILEYGVDRPGDMDYLLSIVRPKIAVVTAIGETPVHVEFFKDPEELVSEKSKLVKALPADGTAILNHDDYAVYDMKEGIKTRVLTYGVEERADFRITNYELRMIKDGSLKDIPAGISFKIEHKGSVVPIRLAGALGFAQAYSAAAAAAVGYILGMNMVDFSEAIGINYAPPPGRLRLLKGNKNSLILDDTYNASPESMRLALDTLRDIPAKRKIAVLGDMLEIGKYTEQAHRAVGDQASEFVDLLFTVGPRAKFIADEARLDLAPEKIKVFEDSLSAGQALDPLIQEGDLILIKGSQAIRMEKVVEEIMAEPEHAKELLARQDGYWKKN